MLYDDLIIKKLWRMCQIGIQRDHLFKLHDCIILDLVKARCLCCWMMSTNAVIILRLAHKVWAQLPNNAAWFNLPSLVTISYGCLFNSRIKLPTFGSNKANLLPLSFTCRVFCQGLAGDGRRRLLQGVCGGGGGCVGAGVVACHVGWRVRWAVVILSVLPLTEGWITVVVLLWETGGTLVDRKTELFEHWSAT